MTCDGKGKPKFVWMDCPICHKKHRGYEFVLVHDNEEHDQ